MRRTKLLLVERLNLLNLFLVLAYYAMGFECKYLYASSLFNLLFKNKKIIKFFIIPLDLSLTKNYNPLLFHGIKHELAEKIYGKIKLRVYEKIVDLFLQLRIEKNKIESFIIYILFKFINNSSLIIYAARNLSEEYKKIVILSFKSVFIYSLIKESFFYKKNCKVIFSSVKTLAGLFIIFKFFSSLLKNLRIFIFKKTTMKKNKIFNKKIKCDLRKHKINKIKILYFPHKGPFYGQLYEKNFIYSEDINSPFYKKNIMHVEYQLFENRNEIENFYIKNDIPYFIIENFSFEDLKRSFNFFFRNIKIFLFLINKNIFILGVIFLAVLDFNRYKRYLLQFKHAKLAYIAYDALFPLTCYFVLSSLNIKTAAHQERFNLLYLPDYQNICFDYYYSWGDYSRKKIKEKKMSHIKYIKNIGPIRIDTLKQRLNKKFDLKSRILSSYGMSEKYTKIITCYDYHSEPFDIQRLDPEFNWLNNSVFYIDIINLSKKYFDCLFIIRGKNNYWCTLDYFKEILEKINNSCNIIIDKEYNQLERSYDLAAISDLIIAKYTSIGDECLAMGIPVIFHDYAKNHIKNFSLLHKYKEHLLFANNFKDLDEKINDYIYLAKKLSGKEFDLLRKNMYNNAHTYEVKKKLHENLSSLLS